MEDLQEELEKLYIWEAENNMKFNGKKFELLRFGNNSNLKEDTNYFTPGMDQIIEEKEVLRDLGVMMANDATFTNHVSTVCKKVNQKSGWIFRTFQCRETLFLKHLWKSLVQPHIDYCSQLYFPSKASDMERIESLLKTFSKKIPALRNLSYWERLKQLKLYSQERRMERYRILYVWKIQKELVPNCGLTFSSDNSRRGLECVIPVLKGPKGVQALREKSFQIHGAKLFNALPKNLRNSNVNNIEDFKSLLDKYLESIPDEPKVGDYIPSACDQVTMKPSNSLICQTQKILRNRGS